MKTYKITYHMYPDPDIEITIQAETLEKAIIFAKDYRKDSYSIKEVKK